MLHNPIGFSFMNFVHFHKMIKKKNIENNFCFCFNQNDVFLVCSFSDVLVPFSASASLTQMGLSLSIKLVSFW